MVHGVSDFRIFAAQLDHFCEFPRQFDAIFVVYIRIMCVFLNLFEFSRYLLTISTQGGYT